MDKAISNGVKEFFEKRVDKFDSIYYPKKKLLWKILDFLFRRSMQKRFELAIEELKDAKAKKVLDIGCGTGRYSIALAEKGVYVLGIDFANRMVIQAQNFAKARNAAAFCSFIAGDFLDYQFNDKFDFCLAIGFFDYIKEPVKHLDKINKITIDKAIISFPAKWRLRNIVRRIRLKILGCPVYFYGRSDIEKILRKACFREFTIRNIGRDYFVVAKG